jgi:predicted phage terminase large subunit-like protein
MDLLQNNNSSLREAEKLKEQLGMEKIKLLRREAKTNLYFLTTTILKYNKLSPNLHGHFATWARRTNNKQFRLILLPRGHYKSTLTTIADSIQICLPDDGGNEPYPRNLGPEVRILIGHEGQEHAARFLTSITSHFRTNALLMALFPKCVPGKGQRMNKTELELPRESFWAEPTIDVMGVGTKAQGRHYDFLKLDDIYGTEARDSESVHKSTILWIDNIQSFLLTPSTDHIDFIGTRYKFEDVYKHIMDVYDTELVRYVRPVVEYDPKLDRKVAIFPEQFPEHTLKILQKNPTVYNSQYLNDPLAGDAEFDRAWERYYKRIKWDSVDRRISYETLEGKQITQSWLELDRLIIVDPATKGNSGIVVTGTNGDRNPKSFILEAIQKAVQPPELVSLIFQLNRKWQPRAVIIEEVLFSQLFRHWIQREQQVKNEYFRILTAKTKQRSKEDRVRGLSTWFANGQIWLHESDEELIRQFRQFPGIKEYHMLDALAYGPEFWRASAGSDEIERRESAIDYIKRTRDPITGYSRVVAPTQNTSRIFR